MIARLVHNTSCMYWYLTQQNNRLSQFLTGIVNTLSVVVLFSIFALIFTSTNLEILASDVGFFSEETKETNVTNVTKQTNEINETQETQESVEPQNESSQDTVGLITDLVFEKPELQDEIAEVKRTLNGQLAEYRQAEQEFSILRGQFAQLNTLSSLEAAIKATRKVMEKRAEVLRTYLNLLRLESLNTTGVKLEYREYVIDQINRLDTALIRHIDQARVSLDRDAIRQTADDFDPLAVEIQTIVALTRQILQLGRYQALYDSTESLIETIQRQSQDPTGDNAIIVTPQDERALGQIISRLKDVNETLDLADQSVTLAIQPKSRNRSVQIEKNISTVYAKLRQVYRFLDELLQNYR